MREVDWCAQETLTIELRGRKVVIVFREPFRGTFDEALARFHPKIDRAQLAEDMRLAGYR